MLRQRGLADNEMRHKYDTRGLVLSRSPQGEANELLALLTSDIGLVYARAQGVRRSGAKLCAALATFAESDVVLVRGRDGWRVAGAVLEESWFTRLPTTDARRRASRVCSLVLRLVAGEAGDRSLLPILQSFLTALSSLPRDQQDAAEVLAALRVLAALGLDAGELPDAPASFTAPILAQVAGERSRYVARINRGIAASGL